MREKSFNALSCFSEDMGLGAVIFWVHRYFELDIYLSEKVQLLLIGNISLVPNNSAVVHLSLYVLQKMYVVYRPAGKIEILYHTADGNDGMHVVAIKPSVLGGTETFGWGRFYMFPANRGTCCAGHIADVQGQAVNYKKVCRFIQRLYEILAYFFRQGEKQFSPPVEYAPVNPMGEIGVFQQPKQLIFRVYALKFCGQPQCDTFPIGPI